MRGIVSLSNKTRSGGALVNRVATAITSACAPLVGNKESRTANGHGGSGCRSAAWLGVEHVAQDTF